MDWLRFPAAIGAALLIASTACVTPFTATGGSGTGAGGSGAIGTGGTSGSGGGASCSVGGCSAGEYCNPASTKCEVCAQSNRFEIGTPVLVGVTLPQAGASALYPRVEQDGKNLYLVQQVVELQPPSHLDQIAQAPMMGKVPSGPAALVPQLQGTFHDSGPLLVEDPMTLGGLAGDIAKQGMAVLLFDSDRLGGRHVFAIPLQVAVSPAQLMLPDSTMAEARVAMAMDAPTPRFFWISGAGGSSEQLVTATATDMTATPVTIQLDTGCPAPMSDTPWVTPGGDRLLFTSVHAAMPGCTPVGPTLTHLYHVPINASGQPTDKAKRVFPSDMTSIDTTPSLTPDQCTLLFARVDAAADGKIYAAPRN